MEWRGVVCGVEFGVGATGLFRSKRSMSKFYVPRFDFGACENYSFWFNCLSVVGSVELGDATF